MSSTQKGLSDLSQLLSEMSPRLQPGTYVFCSLQSTEGIPADSIIVQFREAEGISLILAQERADQLGLQYHFVAAWITLKVHSALAAVGLTAAVAKALTEAQISCNVVAAYYHDHIFVPIADQQRAVEVLDELSTHARKK